ncbi:membrane protein [Novosphingobium barchaimii LL02]|uniref:Membrane protein n=1 Tax=Novosphingobium barchaimii LL02 TaxID=1114963 RepID=A0A0J7Y707_9SPHN|nr:OmpA family protein [Novosphingobium barchaimii]KMS59113.1 membrane protein [Novosphingobium barchaimii LL02]
MRGLPAIPYILAPAALVAAPLLLAGCQPGQPTGGDATEAVATDAPRSVMAEPEADDTIVKKSIIRAEVDAGPTDAPVLEPVQVVVPYPAKGAKPDEAGTALIDGLMTSPTFLAGGPITIWGHSDSRGSDAENLAASRRRAEAARDYLESKGVAKARITVIPLGESRPIAPNRKLDGSDDLEGRTKNRRVEIKVDIPPPPPAAEPQTSD